MFVGRRARWIFVVATAVVAVACGRAPERLARTALSWGATAQRVGEAWLAGEIPEAYAIRTVRSAREGMAEPRRSLSSSAPGLAGRLGALEQAIERLGSALEARDRGAVERATRDVAAHSRAIAADARAEGGR